MLLRSVAVLVAANVLNNRVAPRLAPLTSALATASLVAMARSRGLSWQELGFHQGRRGAVAGGALAAAVAGVYAAGITIPRTRPLFHDERALSLTRARALEEALLQVPVGTVLLEEVGFRGVLYGVLRRTHGTVTATAVSSALFGLWHILPAIDMAKANPALGALVADEEPRRLDTARVVAGSVVSTGAAGVLFCELRRRGGLAAPSLLHVATNSLGYLFARLAAKKAPV
ncbi:CPBP family intramembrane metalloprotease [Nonomuraea sp. NBC_01738]|uniref:CPBP family intramembrane glutamic endopeptidase n=1 Tax=Nonomuraea sp. NBC_01738 TaxID=2976003 RepID=UPI002E102F14|nr:CPBP family intramembrane metalloprotease [Nonomuraea sp. NBC_01738]